jgi:hypothetical protein
MIIAAMLKKKEEVEEEVNTSVYDDYPSFVGNMDKLMAKVDLEPSIILTGEDVDHEDEPSIVAVMSEFVYVEDIHTTEHDFIAEIYP